MEPVLKGISNKPSFTEVPNHLITHIHSYLYDYEVERLSGVNKEFKKDAEKSLRIRLFKNAIDKQNSKILNKIFETYGGMDFVMKQIKNGDKNKILWTAALNKNDLKFMKTLKASNIPMKLVEDRLSDNNIALISKRKHTPKYMNLERKMYDFQIAQNNLLIVTLGKAAERFDYELFSFLIDLSSIKETEAFSLLEKSIGIDEYHNVPKNVAERLAQLNIVKLLLKVSKKCGVKDVIKRC